MLRRRIAQGLAAVAILLVVTAVGGWFWLRSSLPQRDGEVAMAGLHGVVTIARDAYGIPYIRASDEHDAQFALGFVHAQDRLGQMETMRRVASGRMAELAGDGAVGIDRTMRTLGLPELAEGDLASLPAPVRAAVDAYTAGVNAYLTSRRGALPPEFYLLWHEPEPWTATDCLRWGRLMALQLGGGWGDELAWARLAERMPPERIAALSPPYPPDAPISLGKAAAPGRSGALRLPAETQDGSNAWVVAGSATSTGKPILANDPHLALVVPNHWYLVRIDAPGLTLAGASAPGVPFLVLGHNGRVAWGLTTTQGDQADLFAERPSEGVSGSYDTPDGPRPVETRQETIRVRGGADVDLTVRRTRHGPVVSEIYPDAARLAPPGGYMALQSTGLLPGDINAQALYGANRADSVAAFEQAMRTFRAPQQNVFVADRAGAIALEMPALIPIRPMHQALGPKQGWDGAADWTGFAPFEARPRGTDPASGWLVNANNKLVPDDWPYPIAREWPDFYRAERIETVLRAENSISPDDTEALALDTVSLGARDALAALLTAGVTSERARRAVAMLRGWDLRMDRDRAEPLIYAAWVRQAMRSVYGDELGDLFPSWWSERPQLLRRTAETDAAWCDDVGTPRRETCPERFAAALEAALDRLEKDYGNDPAGWRWGVAHQARFDHALFGRVPALRDLLTVRIETDGGNHTINRGGSSFSREAAPFEDLHGPGYRAVYDLADLDASRFMQAVGQSGNPFSEHYADLMPLWRDGRYLRLTPPAAPAHSLRLMPTEGTR